MTMAALAVADLWPTGGARQLPGTLTGPQRAMIVPLDARRAWVPWRWRICADRLSRGAGGAPRRASRRGRVAWGRACFAPGACRLRQRRAAVALGAKQARRS